MAAKRGRKKKANQDRTTVWVSKDTAKRLHRLCGNSGSAADTLDHVVRGLLKFHKEHDGLLEDGRAKVPSWQEYLTPGGEG